jgi:hypothetical protein
MAGCFWFCALWIFFSWARYRVVGYERLKLILTIIHRHTLLLVHLIVICRHRDGGRDRHKLDAVALHMSRILAILRSPSRPAHKTPTYHLLPSNSIKFNLDPFSRPK